MNSMPNTISLQAKQSIRFYAVRGTRLTASRGVVLIHEAPAWVSEQMLVNKLSLRDGESHLLEGSGWVSIEAHQHAELFCVAPESWLSRLGAFMRGVTARMRAREAPPCKQPMLK